MNNDDRIQTLKTRIKNKERRGVGSAIGARLLREYKYELRVLEASR